MQQGDKPGFVFRLGSGQYLKSRNDLHGLFIRHLLKGLAAQCQVLLTFIDDAQFTSYLIGRHCHVAGNHYYPNTSFPLTHIYGVFHIRTNRIGYPDHSDECEIAFISVRVNVLCGKCERSHRFALPPVQRVLDIFGSCTLRESGASGNDYLRCSFQQPDLSVLHVRILNERLHAFRQ